MRNLTSLFLIIALFSCCISNKTKKATTTKISSSWNNPPDSCNVKDSTDWQNVAVLLMKHKNPPKWLDLQGEDIFDLKESISRMKDIPTDIIRDMQVRVASAGGCVVFVDLSDYSGSEMFPMRKNNKVYIYWGVPK